MSKELTATEKKSVIEFMAGKYGMERAAFEAVIKETVMPGNVKNEEFVAFLSVAKEYDLNPLTKEIYAFAKGGRVVPIVPIDGWSRIINRRPELDGIEFNDVVEGGKVISIECKIYRKDRAKPISATEYLEECNVDSSPAWKKWPRRMLRHKALIQAARYAFGLGGIYDPDEGERIKETIVDVTPKAKSGLDVADLKITKPLQPKQVDIEEITQEELPSWLEVAFPGDAVEIKNQQEIENAYKRVSNGLKSMASVKGVNQFFDYSSKQDIEFIIANRPDYYAELVALKSKRLEELK